MFSGRIIARRCGWDVRPEPIKYRRSQYRVAPSTELRPARGGGAVLGILRLWREGLIPFPAAAGLGRISLGAMHSITPLYPILPLSGIFSLASPNLDPRD